MDMTRGIVNLPPRRCRAMHQGAGRSQSWRDINAGFHRFYLDRGLPVPAVSSDYIEDWHGFVKWAERCEDEDRRKESDSHVCKSDNGSGEDANSTSLAKVLS